MNSGTATDLLTSITDPRGLTTGIAYYVENRIGMGSPYSPTDQSVHAYRVDEPGGRTTYMLPKPTSVYAYLENNGQMTPHPADISSSLSADCIYDGAMSVRELDSGVSTPTLAFGVTLSENSGVTSVDTVLPHHYFYWYPAPRYTVATKSYDDSTEDLVTNVDTITRRTSAQVSDGMALDYSASGPYIQSVTTTNSYNFMGQPLRSTLSSQEIVQGGQTNVTRAPTSVDHTYWGADKYYQLKATQDQGGRYSFTDYYPNTAPAGKRGQTYRVYDPKNGGITLDSNAALPGYATSATAWRYQVTPATSQYSAQFDYDAQGRPVDVWKLQSVTSSPWSYVRTHTSYGADGTPGWGQASQVVEDYGGINRTTATNAYTSWGKASDVIDAAGHEFVTSFDPDGLVQSVTRTDGGLNQTLVSYGYGSSGVANGQPTQVTDGLSGVTQTISYTLSGGGIGMPASVTETNGNDVYSTSYAYDAAGNRQTAAYATPSGTQRWGYYGYTQVGGTSPQRAFTRLVRLDGAGNPTAEEMDYQYDTAGRLREATFAMSPAIANGQSYVPSTGGFYYDSNHLASTRARAHYDYDPEGHLRVVSTNWDVWGGNGYNAPTIIANNTCAYEVNAALNRGLKTSSAFSLQNAAGNGYDTRTETYGYDPQLDYLTSASYGDGNPNATPSWAYDAAGNRNDAACDNLNRATSLGGAAVTNDVLGNRMTKGGTTYGWDCLNRMTSLSGSVTAGYIYRADGMRVAKQTGGVTTLYRHDGQMPIEDDEIPASGPATVTKYGMGGRGVDMIERTNSSGTVTAFPIYDAHGNNVASLTRSGSGFSLGDRRAYDA